MGSALKQWARPLCDYTRVDDLTHESTGVLETSAVTKWVTGLVTSATVVAAGDAVEAFSVNYRSDLVSRLSLCIFYFVRSRWFIGFVLVARAFVQLSVSRSSP